MQYDANTPQEYLDNLDDDWRKEQLAQLRAIIMQKGPHIKEGIEYKMLSYSDNDGPIMHLNAQKAFVGLYVGNIKKVDPSGQLLKGCNMGKGCIRIKKTTSIPESGIDKFIDRLLQLRKKGSDISC